MIDRLNKFIKHHERKVKYHQEKADDLKKKKAVLKAVGFNYKGKK